MAKSVKKIKFKLPVDPLVICAILAVVGFAIWQYNTAKQNQGTDLSGWFPPAAGLPAYNGIANNSTGVVASACNIQFPGSVPIKYQLTTGGYATTQLTGRALTTKLNVGQSKFVTIDVNNARLFKITNLSPILGSPACRADALNKRFTYKITCINDLGKPGLEAAIMINCKDQSVPGITLGIWDDWLSGWTWWYDFWNYRTPQQLEDAVANTIFAVKNLAGYCGGSNVHCLCQATNELPKEGHKITFRNDDPQLKDIDEWAAIEIVNYWKETCGAAGVCTTCSNTVNPEWCIVCCGKCAKY